MPSFFAILDTRDNLGFVLIGNEANSGSSAPSYPQAVKATDPKTAGKYYVEFEIGDIGVAIFAQLPSIGIAMLGAPMLGLQNQFSGNNRAAQLLTSGLLRVDTTNYSATTAAFGAGDTISMAVDLDNSTIWFRKNGGDWNNNGSADPASNTDGVSLSPIAGGNFVIAITNPPGNSDFTAAANTAPALSPASPFTYAVPAGFTEGWPANEFPPVTSYTSGGGSDLGIAKATAYAELAPPVGIAFRKMTGEAVFSPPGAAIRKLTAEAELGPPRLAVRKLTAEAPLSPPGLAIRKLTAYAFLYNFDFTGGPNSMPPPIYPELIGLTYTVTKRPIWSTGAARAGSGRTIRVGYFAVNMWEFELAYDFLPDEEGGTTGNDLRALEGFFLLPAVSGGLGGFLFDDTDDDTIEAQAIGTTDGASSNWLIIRQFWAGESVLEPVGYVNIGKTLTVYLNGTPVSAADYTINQSTPMQQLLTFNTPPTAGQAITMDFSWYFYVRFQDDKLDFKKFVEKLWQQDKIVLESLRGP